jgi:hypothetical protein
MPWVGVAWVTDEEREGVGQTQVGGELHHGQDPEM